MSNTKWNYIFSSSDWWLESRSRLSIVDCSVVVDTVMRDRKKTNTRKWLKFHHHHTTHVWMISDWEHHFQYEKYPTEYTFYTFDFSATFFHPFFILFCRYFDYFVDGYPCIAFDELTALAFVNWLTWILNATIQSDYPYKIDSISNKIEWKYRCNVIVSMTFHQITCERKQQHIFNKEEAWKKRVDKPTDASMTSTKYYSWLRKRMRNGGATMLESAASEISSRKRCNGIATNTHTHTYKCFHKNSTLCIRITDIV